MKNKALLFLFIFFHLMATNANANSNFFGQRYRGWLWFDDAPRAEEKSKETEQSTAPTIAQMEQAKAENEEFARELELLKHLAVRHPENLEYIKLYKLKEKEMMDNAQLLGINWLMANFLNPEIVDELKNPQNIYGRDIKNQQQQADDRATLQELATKVELFVFRQDGCPHCPVLEKHLKNFVAKHGFKVEAISPDHSKSKYFTTHTSQELIEALGLTIMPTVIAVVNDSRQRFELARGAVSVVDMEEKALLLAKHLGIKADQGSIDAEQLTTTKAGLGCTSCQE
jgi:conjugal transfer pilus assembly protein TraF